MRTYSTGTNRVHASIPEPEVLATIAEYEAKADTFPPDLATELRACVVELREELEWRKAESWRR
ncbi:MAG: hypothetical protein VW239_06810 [Candidatus Nanopelagicales bacterium]